MQLTQPLFRNFPIYFRSMGYVHLNIRFQSKENSSTKQILTKMNDNDDDIFFMLAANVTVFLSAESSHISVVESQCL